MSRIRAEDESAASRRDLPACRMPYCPLVVVLLAVSAGMAVDRGAAVSLAQWIGLGAVAYGVWWAAHRAHRDRLAAWVLLLAVAALAGAWHHARWRLFADDDVAALATRQRQPICLEGFVAANPRHLPAAPDDPMRPIPLGERSQVTVRLTAVRHGDSWEPIAGNVRLSVDGRLDSVRAGDRIRVFGQLAAPRTPQNWGEFDFAHFARGDRITGDLLAGWPECVAVVQAAAGATPAVRLASVRAAGQRLLRECIPADRYDLAATMLLGAREELLRERTTAFLETGTIHLLAISGLHVGIIALLLHLAGRGLLLPRKATALFVAAVVVGYVLVIEARPPAVRAAILVAVTSLAVVIGRRALSMNSLAAAALVVLAFNPADLFRTGPQLSFLAVGGLVWTGRRFAFWEAEIDDPIERLLVAERGWIERALRAVGRWALGLLVAGTVVYLVTLPLAATRFNVVTPAAPLMNVLLWVPMCLALGSGFLLLTFGWFFGPMAALAAGVCDWALWSMETIIAAARQTPGSHFWVAGLPEWWLLGFYGLLLGGSAVPPGRLRRRWVVAALAVWIAVAALPPARARPPRELEIAFLSMGHGAAVVLHLPSGETILYDAGRLVSPEGGAQSISRYLWARGITTIDTVVISHADLDHYGALPRLLERFPVGRICTGPGMFDEPTPPLKALRQAIREAAVPVEVVSDGHRWERSGTVIEVIHPPEGGVAGGDNANSLVLRIAHCGWTILLPGDVEGPGLERLLDAEALGCDILMAPHHGSVRSNPAGLAEQARPQWVIVSGSERAGFDQVAAGYHRVGAGVFHTARRGAVKIGIREKGAYLTTHDGIGAFLPAATE